MIDFIMVALGHIIHSQPGNSRLMHCMLSLSMGPLRHPRLSLRQAQKKRKTGHKNTAPHLG